VHLIFPWNNFSELPTWWAMVAMVGQLTGIKTYFFTIKFWVIVFYIPILGGQCMAG
jgi:hypothetical protein